MSNQDDKLAQNLNGLNLNNQKEQKPRFQFNPSSQPAFVPGQPSSGANPYSQYGQFYSGQQRNNPQAFNSYDRNYSFQNNSNSYDRSGYRGGYEEDQDPEPETKTLTLEEFAKQKKAAAASLNRPRILKKPAVKSGEDEGSESKEESKVKAPEAKTEAKTETKPVDVKNESKNVQSQIDSNTSSKIESSEPAKPVSSAPKEEEKSSKPATNQSSTKKSQAAQVNLVEEQEKDLDKEILQDMFGVGADVKEHMSIIFMGHVDAGKSTMGGNILYLTGAVDKRTVEKYEKEAKDAGRQGWYLSWVMDTNKEERAEGKTVEVGRAFFETEKRRYTILDAPGHKMYVPSMIGGASQADVGILVISARKGEYETGFEKGGQTREHAILAKTQGVNRLIVVVNKMDDPTVNWSKERYDECITKLQVFLKGIGYNVKTDVVFMPVSGYTGAGLKDRVPQKEVAWYDGPSLLEYLDSIQLEARKMNAPFMLPVSSKSKDLGTVVEGKIESGSVKKGDALLLMPVSTKVEVAAVYNESEAEVPGAIVGEQVKLKLKNIEEEDISTGFVLTSTQKPVRTATKFEAQVAIVEHKSILTNGFSCVMHVHTAVEEVTFNKLLHKLEKGTNRKSKKPPAFAKRGMKIIAELEASRPVCIESFDDYPQLGRFTLRDQGITVAIGKVIRIME